MTHVSVERLRASRTEKDRAENQKAGDAVPKQISKPVAGIECYQHAWMAHYSAKSEHSDSHEPDGHNRAEQFADAFGALGLKRKKSDQDQCRKATI